MGQQQLLLIVLSVVIVGIAIVVGISMFNSNAIDTNRDSIIHELHNLSYHAYSYYKKPGPMGGGNNSFIGFNIPNGINSTANGTYNVTSVTKEVVEITAVGNEPGDDIGTAEGKISYKATITTKGVVDLIKIN